MFNKAKKVLTKLLAFSFVACCTVGLTMGLTGCGDEPSDSSGNNTPVAVSVKSIEKQEDGSLLITFTDGKTQKIELSNNSQPAACTHENKTTVVLRGERQDQFDILDGLVEVEDWEAQGCLGLNICECGYVEVSENAPHVLATITEEPTCTEEGYTAKGCLFCDYEVEKTDVVDALGHDYATKYSVKPGDLLCEDGGFAVQYCKTCGEVDNDSVVEIKAGVHHSKAWTLSKEEEAKLIKGEAAVLVGICDNCNVIVNGVEFVGCMKEQTYALPALTDSAWVVTGETQTDCSKKGSATYTITVDGQEFSVKADIAPKKHVIAEGVELAANDVIYDDDAKYVGWELLANKEISCDADPETMEANAIFECTDCGKKVLIKVIAHHVKPEAEEIVYKADTLCTADDKITYTCETCGKEVKEAIEHNISYTMKQVGEKFYLSGKCANEGCPHVIDAREVEGVYEKTEESVAPTCTENGKKVWAYTEAGIEYTAEEVVLKLDHLLGEETIKAGGFYDIDKYAGKIEIADNGADDVTCANGANVQGTFECDRCTKTVLVNLFAAHKVPEVKTEENYQAPTCTVDGWYICTECEEQQNITAPGHAFKYTWKETTATDYVVGVSCTNKGCEDTFEDRVIAKVRCEVSEDPTNPATCTSEGTLIIKIYAETAGVGEVQDTIYAKSEKKAHKLTMGNETVDMPINNPLTADGVYSYDDYEDYVELADDGKGLPECNEGTSVSATFRCPECKKIVIIQVRKGHTKPAEKAEDDQLVVGKYITVAPTCTEAGYDLWFCTVCQTEETDVAKANKPHTVPATGHVWETSTFVAPTETTTGTLLIVCSAENCNLHTNTQTITLPVLGSEDYTVKHLDAACDQAEVTKYTLSASKIAEKLSAVLGTNVAAEDCNDYTFEIAAGEASGHNKGQEIVWTVANEAEGYIITYTGHYCDKCDMIIIASVTTAWVELAPATPVAPEANA